MAMGMPMWPKWANDHGVAHLEAETISMNLIWSESGRTARWTDRQMDGWRSLSMN